MGVLRTSIAMESPVLPLLLKIMLASLCCMCAAELAHVTPEDDILGVVSTASLRPPDEHAALNNNNPLCNISPTDAADVVVCPAADDDVVAIAAAVSLSAAHFGITQPKLTILTKLTSAAKTKGFLLLHVMRKKMWYCFNMRMRQALSYQITSASCSMCKTIRRVIPSRCFRVRPQRPEATPSLQAGRAVEHARALGI